MKTTLLGLSLLTAAIIAGSIPVLGQEGQPQTTPQPQRQRPAPRPGGGAGNPGAAAGLARMNPLFSALDANGDGVIDSGEINGAVAALRKLDKNADGKLTGDELRPGVPRGGGRDATEIRDGRTGERDPASAANRLMQYDKNADGKVARDEIPEGMQAVFDRADKNKDGYLSVDEIKAVAEAPRPAAPSAPTAPQPPIR